MACFPCNQADSWQQLNYGLSDLQTYCPLSGHEETLETSK